VTIDCFGAVWCLRLQGRRIFAFQKTLISDFFFQAFAVKIVKCNETDMEFDLIGVHAAIANAFRRLLLSEVSC